MPLKRKLQVFVSSTFDDLHAERQAAVEAILNAGHIPAGMELFTAGDESQMKVIKRWIDESDVYMLILGGRYGSVEPESGKSYTHLEYDYAQEICKPHFSLVITDQHLENKVKNVGTAMIERQEPKKLEAFRAEVKSKAIVRFFDDIKDIKLAIGESLRELDSRDDLFGWVPGKEAGNTLLMAEEITRLSRENADLREWNQKLQNDHSSNTLIPKVDAEINLVSDSYPWPMRDPDILAPFKVTELHNDPSIYNLESRKGFWLHIDIGNLGTLAAEITVQVEADEFIVSREDIISSNHIKILALHGKRGKYDGWRKGLLGKDNQKYAWKMHATVESVKPGENFDLVLPIDPMALASRVDSRIIMKVSPNAGQHVEKSFQLKDLMPEFAHSS